MIDAPSSFLALGCGMRQPKIKSVAIFAASMTLCAAAAAQATNEITKSRIRVFGQNGAFADMFSGSACIKSSGGERVSGGMSDAFGSMFGLVSNTSLGIAETETTRNLERKNGVLSKAYYREYVIPSGVPTSLKLGFKDVSTFYHRAGVQYSSASPSCFGTISFTPVSDQDYEVGFDWSGNVCLLTVNRVVQENGEVVLEPVPVSVAPDC